MGPHTGRCKCLQYSGWMFTTGKRIGGGRWQVAGMQEEEVHPDSLVLVITIGKC